MGTGEERVGGKMRRKDWEKDKEGLGKVEERAGKGEVRLPPSLNLFPLICLHIFNDDVTVYSHSRLFPS